MELNDLYDHLWNMGSLLQGEDALSILDAGYRPWPRVRYSHATSCSYYDHLERNKTAEWIELKQYEKWVDLATYRPILVEVLQLYGIALHTSLERILGKYDWEQEKVAKLLCTNNLAERPFAVAKGSSLCPF
jgi:hypothetical protein